MIQNVKKILAPLDFSEHSMAAMHGAWELAQETDADVHIVHVVVPHHSFIPLMLVSNAEQDRELMRESAMEQQAEEELARIKKDEFKNSKKVSTAVLKGAAVQCLVDYAKKNAIDLILLSTHGRTGGETILIGSVTEKLVRHAPCSVLVFRRRDRGAPAAS
ncbi:MAG TPA: universal stress protein [Candidatus Binataceae bacterium]|nr:universal stress protein [Candidatus Binataceae bacterium]